MIIVKNGENMEVITLFPDGFASNCYIVHNGKDAYVIDPSLSCDRIVGELEKRDLSLIGILLTHGHFDHILALDELRERTGAPVYIHRLDADALGDSQKNAYSVFFGGIFTARCADSLLSDGDVLWLGDEPIKVIHTPGHTRGSVCFDLSDKLITGDTLFAEGFGRYDLWGGDRETLILSLNKLSSIAKLSDKTIYSGHGECAMLRASLDRINYFLC